MKFAKKNFTFDKSEIFIMFLLLLLSSMLVFSIGIMMGKRLLENECRIILEDCQNKLQENTQTESDLSTSTTVNDTLSKQPKTQNFDVTPEEVKPISKPKAEPEIEKSEDTVKAPLSDDLLIKPEFEKDHLAIKTITNEIRGKYTVQISSHRDEEEAKNISYELYKLGFKSAYYMESVIPNKGTWYRVGIGFFQNHSSAVKFAEMLKQSDKISSYIVRKIN